VTIARSRAAALVLFCVGFSLVESTAGVSAASILGLTWRTNPVSGTVNGGEEFNLLPVNNAGNTALPFTTTANNRWVRITYNAKCNATAGGQTSYVSIAILVDGLGAQPWVGAGSAFCPAIGPSDLGHA
jgi:hypothetical protein